MSASQNRRGYRLRHMNWEGKPRKLAAVLRRLAAKYGLLGVRLELPAALMPTGADIENESGDRVLVDVAVDRFDAGRDLLAYVGIRGESGEIEDAQTVRVPTAALPGRALVTYNVNDRGLWALDREGNVCYVGPIQDAQVING